jgi:hypothetical protein
MATVKQRPSAEKSNSELFEKLNLFIETLSPWIHGATVPDDGPLFGNAKISILFRALNQYRAIVNLLKNNHWEDGLTLVRSMFELLLNAEELVRQEQTHPEKASRKFFLFSELQNYLVLREIWLYHVAIGRKPPEYEKMVKELDKWARKIFAPFWRTPKGKKPREVWKMNWKDSWHNKSRWKLSEESSDPDRKYQYKIAYSMGSQFTHSGPEAVTPLMFVTKKDQIEWQEFIAHMDRSEELGTRIVARNSTGFFMEIVELLRDCLPDYDQDWVDNAFEIIGTI